MNDRRFRMHSARHRTVAVGLLLCLLALNLTAAVQGPPRLVSQHYAISWSAFSYAGGQTSSSHYEIFGVLSHYGGSPMQSQAYKILSGFISGGSILKQNNYRSFLPAICR